MTDKKTEALKLALKKAFDLGQRYWDQADSDYPSQWRKADVTRASFNQLIEDTIREALAEQPAINAGPITPAMVHGPTPEQKAQMVEAMSKLAEQSAQQQSGSSRDAQETPFEAWWENHGQFLRAGGGQYEKTFAWHAWCEAAKSAQQQEPVARVVEAYATKAPTIQAISGKEHQLRVGDFLYTSPQPSKPIGAKPWVRLTDEDISNVCGFAEYTTPSTRFALTAISRSIEDKLRELNEHREKNA